jgi:hypothetical protein
MLHRAKLRLAAAAVTTVVLASAAAYAVCSSKPSAQAASAPAMEAVPNEIWGESLMVRLSSDGKQLIGYSTATGTWEAAANVDAAPMFRAMVVGTRVAAGVDGARVAGFGATAGRWAIADAPGATSVIVGDGLAVCVAAGNRVLALSEASGGWAAVTLAGPIEGEPVVSSRYVHVHAGGKLYVFSPATGKWAEPIP